MTLRIITSRFRTCRSPLSRTVGVNFQTSLLGLTSTINCSRYLDVHTTRSFASDSSSKPSDPNAWRKQQLENLQKKFTAENTIESEEDLQPMWKEMEGRVTRRRPRTLADTRGKTGRVNVRKTDEEVWLAEGMYSADGDSKKDGK